MNVYIFKVNLKFTNAGIQGDNVEHAKENLKDLYKEQYDIELTDEEIKVVGVIKNARQKGTR